MSRDRRSEDAPLENSTGSDNSPENRLRRGPEEFKFDWLLDGVSTQDEDEAPGTVSASAHRHTERASDVVLLPGMARPERLHEDDSLLSAPEFHRSPPEYPPSGSSSDEVFPSQQRRQLRRRQQRHRQSQLLKIFAFVCLSGALLTVLFLRARGGSGTERGASSQVAAVTAGAPAGTERNPGRPDPALTPGERVPGERRQGATIPVEVRQKVFVAYGIDPNDQRFVLCHLVPPSLGGTDNPQNLFPTTPWFNDLKTRLDRRLTSLVAEGKMTPEQAERELTTDWIASMHRHQIRNYGQADGSVTQ